MKWFRRDDRPLFVSPDINTDDQIRVGKLAKRLLIDDIFLHSVERASARIRVRWMAENDPSAREDLWRAQQAFMYIRQELDQIVAEGTAAEAILEGDTRLAVIGD